MASAPELIWRGESRTKYTYRLYEIGAKFKEIPANYIFCKKSANYWKSVYIGETGDLSERFDSHHRWDCIQEEKASHICAHKSSDDKSTRCKEEAGLIAYYNPPCNR